MRHENFLHIEGVSKPIIVRNNPRARRFTLRVSHTKQQAILTLPPRTKINEAKTFVANHLEWLQAQLENLPDAVPFAHGNLLPLRGDNHLIRFVDGRGKSGVVTITQTLHNKSLEVTGGISHGPRRLTDWLKKQARQDLEKRVTFHASNLNLTPKKITIRDQTSRWGSCSSTGALSFSWRLILSPPLVLDYVAAHEVAHLAEMNHGPRFWKLVRQTMPQMERAQHWLKMNGTELHRYGASADG